MTTYLDGLLWTLLSALWALGALTPVLVAGTLIWALYGPLRAWSRRLYAWRTARRLRKNPEYLTVEQG